MTEYLKGKLKFDIAELLIQITGSQDDVYLNITPCKVLSGFNTIDMSRITALNFEFENNQTWLYVYYDDGTSESISDIQTEISSGIIELYGASYYEAVPDITEVITKMDNDYSIFTYRLNSERNVVNKSLISVGLLIGYFRSAINIKSPIINIENYEIEDTFNYIYVPSLNRYYYVTNIELSTKNIATLQLNEDVLMSHKDLILQQTAFIDRQEFDYNDDLVDDLVITKYNKNVDYNIVNYSTNIFKDISDQDYYGDYIVMTVNSEI